MKKLLQTKQNLQKAEKKLSDLTKKVAQILEKGYDFLLGTSYFTGNDGYQNYLVFVPMLTSLTLDNIKKSY